ncbi:hypothetical protein BASA50_005268 [Batrachochytrium salamandrivorans]|uniref:Autophagy-related protein 17 n=1 Tax=Batrachochytrium salamandrivorans TaxID=1357716 RepID=A0ABQ8FD65_9FUNG|nr:hypothetical protein BASA60_009666 [Batrachochytrium salamandrivorans]KAH6589849.1 hypothetical protein BASA61_005492 [Batrachochytrium salamandrivorans]KAH6596226.1 hypothetical protein BASA50_005268 [Batrachochytrium salamandrivorans]KAH6598421.1 hypothetical protein BASA61_002852 [Batrachochytrium salamandrivorans]KAH9272096.1 hypothetical protein BASA83_005685 [Batrachochytrium salamandrivorans]
MPLVLQPLRDSTKDHHHRVHIAGPVASNTASPRTADTLRQEEPTDIQASAAIAAGIAAMTSMAPLPRVKPGDSLITLTTLVADLTAAKKHSAPRLKDVQELAERTWRANVAYERRLAQLQRERKQLERLTETVWRRFDELIMPLWRFEDFMVPIYEELCMIYTGLDKLHITPSSAQGPSRSTELREFQERLHVLENNMVDGKIVPSGWSQHEGGHIPSGQAMCVSLMERCYKLAHKISESESIVDPSLEKISGMLEGIVSSMRSLLDSVQDGYSIEPIELHVYQQQVQAIDSLQKDGKFLDAKGNIPEGQATVHDQLEEAFDLIHECIVELESQQRVDDFSSDMIHSLTDRINDVRTGLSGYTDVATAGVYSISKPALSLMYNVIGEGVALVKDTVTHPQQVTSSAYSKLRSVVSSSLSFVTRIGEQLEPIDESLGSYHAKLFLIRQTLKTMRNQRNRAYLTAQASSSASSDAEKLLQQETFSEFKKAYGTQLDELLTDLRKVDKTRVNGKFVNDQGETPSGQVPLGALLEECFCLAMGMADETIA